MYTYDMYTGNSLCNYYVLLDIVDHEFQIQI